MAYALSNSCMGQTFAFWMSSGVLQGCPGSGFAYCWASYPIVEWIRRAVDVAGIGISRCIADDVAISLRSLRHLPTLHEIFDTTEKGTNLVLAKNKCIAVPLAYAFSDEAEARMKGTIASLAPAWSDFTVASCATYAGALIGPGATLKKHLEASYGQIRKKSPQYCDFWSLHWHLDCHLHYLRDPCAWFYCPDVSVTYRFYHARTFRHLSDLARPSELALLGTIPFLY